MSTKDLFERSTVYVPDTDQKDAFADAESSRNVKAISEKQRAFEPQIDYNDPLSFARFGSAELYYQSAIDRIVDFYPYDGSDAEYNEFYNKSLDIEKFVFNNLYPRTNGYVNFADSYISLKGGPHTISSTSTKGLFKDPESSQRETANIYDEDLYTTEGLPSDYGQGTRESNLKCDFQKGVTIEFWLKNHELGTGEKRAIFHLTNSSGGDEFTLYLSDSAGSPFYATLSASNAAVFGEKQIGSTPDTSSIESWNHYAVSFKSASLGITTKFYLNGVLDQTTTLGSAGVDTLTQPETLAYIGSGSHDEGHLHLSGAMDEFRFWKVERTAQDIGRNWFGQVRGGSNTDISNTTLGVYYKFNEGITGVEATDKIVLDYSGRISNGTFTGYTTSTRNTGSAIVSASAATSEYLDPIIYATHPSVSSLRTSLIDKGADHDMRNNAAFATFMPSWIMEEHEELGNTNFKYLSHIVGAYFDKLYLQIEAVSTLKSPIYTSSSYKPIPFAEHMPASLGLETPEIFVDSTVMEKFLNRNESEAFENDLSEVKNLIYLNLYNNLTYLFKSKGTEKAVRNVLRAFNIDDKLVRFNTYANNFTYDLENNLKQTVLRKSSVNFNNKDHLGAVVYSSASSDSTQLGYISGSGLDSHELRYGLTHEVDVIFPKFVKVIDTFDRAFTRVSLFGLHSASSDSAQTTVYDPSFYVYAERDKSYSKNIKFVLSSSLLSSEISSSLFHSVYDDEDWNLSVRIKPNSLGLTGSVDDVTTASYTMEFTGYNQRLGEIRNRFKVTGSVSSDGDTRNLLKSSKRVFVGAHRTNVTGALQYKSDVLISATRYWTQYLDETSLQQHALDFENYGVTDANNHLSPLDADNSKTLNRHTLALNYEFGNVTGSDTSGGFTVTDISSGSLDARNEQYGKLGAISGYLYPGVGFGFEAGATDVVLKQEVNTHQFINPELVIGDNLVQIRTDDDKLFDSVDTIPNYHHILEKSMYNAISEEMLNFFAGVTDFHNLIGHPVHMYRMEYKGLNKLKEAFFRRVTDVAEVERFVDYYKWFDDAVSQIISQLIPASAEYTPDILNTVESHVLERNKFQHRIPTLAFTSSTEGVAFGAEEMRYDWARNHAPVSGLERDNSDWWRDRAEREGVISSGDTGVDSDRTQLRKVITNKTNGGVGRSFTDSGSKYSRSNFKYRTLSKGVVFENKISKEIKGGTNFEHSKDIHYTYTALHPAGPINRDNNVFVPKNVLLGFTDDLVALEDTSDPPENPAAKVKRTILVQHGRDWEDGLGYKNVKSSKAFPFNIVSSSVKSGYNAHVIARATASIEITNLHNDVYGPDMERPMQGPFTNYAVGGHQSRHIKLNAGSDNYLNRPEAWKIALGRCSNTDGAIGMVGADYPTPEANGVNETPYPMTGAMKATYYRDELAKRPVNIRNIQHRTGSTILGNYNANYDVVHTVGGYSNPRSFIDEQPTLPAVVEGADVAKTILDGARGRDGHFIFVDDYNAGYLTGSGAHKNKTVIVSRFSSPGSFESMTPAFKDFRSGDFSVYNTINNRNLTTRRLFQGVTSSIVSETKGVRSFDHTGRDFGFTNLAARHATRFFRDSTLVADVDYSNVPRNSVITSSGPGNADDAFSEKPSFHKVHRNNLLKAREVVTYTTEYIGPSLTNLSGAKLPALQNESLFVGRLDNDGGSMVDLDQMFRSGSIDAMYNNGFTFSTWFAADAWTAPQRIFMSFGAPQTPQPLTQETVSIRRGAISGNNAKLSIIFYLWDGATTFSELIYETNNHCLEANSNYHHLLVSIDGSNGSLGTQFDIEVYVDGTPQAVTKTAGSVLDYYSHHNRELWTSVGNRLKAWNGGTGYFLGPLESIIMIGGSSAQINGEVFSGSLDEVSLWTIPMDSSNISEIYNGGVPCDLTASATYLSNSSGMVGWWRMGDVPNDAVGLNNPGSFILSSNSIVNVSGSGVGSLTPLATKGVNNNIDLNDSNVLAGCTPTEVQVPVTSYVCDQKYDNLNLHHQIPRSDRQYSWIGHSITHTGACEPRYSGFMSVNSPLAPYYEITGNYYPFFDYVSASFSKNGIFQNTTRLNIFNSDPVGLETNTLGSSSIPGALSTPGGSGAGLNTLLIRRGDTYGWNWRAHRMHDHPILNREHNENQITAVKNDSIKQFNLPPVSLRGRPVVVNMNVDGQNVSLKATHNNEKIYFNQRELNDLVFQTEDPTLTPFDQLLEVSQQQGSSLNWVHYSETFFPSTVNEFVKSSRERVGYDNKFWRDNQDDRVTLGATFTNSFNRVVSQSAWILDAQEDFLTRAEVVAITSLDPTPPPIRSYEMISEGKSGELQNNYFHYVSNSLGAAFGTSFTRITSQAPGALYSRKQLLTSPNSVVSRTGFAQTGTLGNSFSDQIPIGAGEALWEAGTRATINIKSGSSFVTSSQPSEPWFDEYGDFREDLQLVARDYAIIPEFRISEHINDYVKGGTFNKFKFDTFEIPGTTNNSSQRNFYKDYSNSDFLREFASIKDKSGLNAKEIMLTCKAAVRFNPYKGFYPSQRTIDLVSQFSSSFAAGFAASFASGSDEIINSDELIENYGGAIRPLVQPLFAPGILYNSIKSGIAVDYPVVLNPDKFAIDNYQGGSSDAQNYMIKGIGSKENTSGSFAGWNTATSFFDLRVPFEAMVEPSKYIDKVQFIDFEPHPSASINSTASVDTSVSDGIYELMAKNFFGQTGDFFLKDSSYTKIQSDLIQDGLKFSNSEVYAARLKIRKSHNGNRFYNKEYDSSGNTGSASDFTTFGARPYSGSQVITGSFPLPQDPAHNTGFQETFTMYSRPTSFGPAITGRGTATAAQQGAFLSGTLDSIEGFNWAYTPPYYHGESWVDFVFRPESGKEYTLEDVLSETKAVYWRVDPGEDDGSDQRLIQNFAAATQELPIAPYGGEFINSSSMQLNSSLNLFGVERVPKKRKDKFGNTILDQNELAGKRWVIQPKWETPMLNFANVKDENDVDIPANITYPTNFSESVPRGMWHQFGEIPRDPNTGIFLEIGDIPSDWLKYHYDVINSGSVYNNNDPAGSGSTAYLDYQSLTDLFGFQRSQKKDSAQVRLGEIADKREVYEAVVAIPYIIEANEDYGNAKTDDDKRRKKFINIPRQRLSAALKEREGSQDGDSLEAAGESIRKMVQKMKRYVMPPQFDFINFDEIDPIVMYFFEFKYEFDKDDLSYIWQNLAPRDYKKITFQEASVAHDLMNTELLEESNLMDNPNLRWMVFKVKQKATKDYYDLIPPQIKAARPTSNLDKPETDKDDEYLQFNWPYDYLSFVELVKLEADVLYKADDEGSE